MDGDRACSAVTTTPTHRRDVAVTRLPDPAP